MAKLSKPKKAEKLRNFGVYIIALLHFEDLIVKWHKGWFFPRQHQSDDKESERKEADTHGEEEESKDNEEGDSESAKDDESKYDGVMALDESASLFPPDSEEF